ncbi:peptidase inhibitor family I36 protein [Streptomyces sioyaensis]|uniref:peptidase inhibitor family I36 protein n=1 Tax=Streptomyces sioyaensis TaxID=67364 RepID=UPI0037D75BFB
MQGCSDGEFCEWTGTNYTGTFSVSHAASGVCFNGSNYTRSLQNRTHRYVQLWAGTDCTGFLGGVSSGESWPNSPIRFQSYRAI